MEQFGLYRNAGSLKVCKYKRNRLSFVFQKKTSAASKGEGFAGCRLGAGRPLEHVVVVFKGKKRNLEHRGLGDYG